MKNCRLLFILLILLADFLWASTLPVRLLSERHRTEWNWVEYRLSLTNFSSSSLVNPTIRYFAENPRIQYCVVHPNDTGCEGMVFDVYDVDYEAIGANQNVTFKEAFDRRDEELLKMICQ